MSDTNADMPLGRLVGSLSLRPVVRVPAGASLQEAARVLRGANVSSALVGDGPRRIVTERDLCRALAEGLGPSDAVASVVQHIPVWATTTSQVFDVAVMMLQHQVRHLVVVSPAGEEAGIVSMRDVLALVLPAHLALPDGEEG